MTNPDICSEKKCKRPADLTYLEKPLCQKHWELLCAKQDKEEVLNRGLEDAKNKRFSDSLSDLETDKNLCDNLEDLGDNDVKGL